MAQLEVRTFWERLRWFAPVTIIVLVMPVTLLLFHFVSNWLGLTSSTLVLLPITILFSLGSGVWVSILLSLESDLYLNYYLTPPLHSFRVADKNGVTTLIVYAITSISISALVKAIATKQIEIQALLEKVEALTSKSSGKGVGTYIMGKWRIDIKRHTITVASGPGKDVHLTPIEWRVLEVLVRAEGGLVSQSEVLKQVWGAKYSKETNYLRLYLSQLRKKLEESPKRPSLLITEPGNGYRAIATLEVDGK
jgi:DNA-binding winged helix-turn-helix (wHTH) protein